MAADSYISCNLPKSQRVRKDKTKTDLLICKEYSTSADFKLSQHNAIGVAEEMYYTLPVLSYETTENRRRRGVSQLAEQFETVVLRDIEKPVERWDENHGTYNPWQNTETRAVLRNLICAPKSEKKAFKKRERIRIKNIIQVRQNHSKHCWNPLAFAERMKKLSINDIDTLIDSVDFSKLHLSISNGSSSMEESDATKVQQVLIPKLKALLIGCLKR